MLAYLLVLIGVLGRLIPHLPNVTPVTAAVLFGGAYLPKQTALLVPLAILIISDLILGLHATIPFTWGSFLLIGLLGVWLRDRRAPLPVMGGTLASSLLFFLVSNFGVWLVGGLYPPTFNGLVMSYMAGLPFLRDAALGDLFYAGVFFGGYALVQAHLRRRAVPQMP